MTDCKNCKYDLPHTWNHECAAGRERLRDCNQSIMLVCSSFDKKTLKEVKIMSRWVTGKTLLKYYDFTDYAMRQIKKSDACIQESHNTYLYNIDDPAISGRKIVIPEIPEHLIRYANDV